MPGVVLQFLRDGESTENESDADRSQETEHDGSTLRRRNAGSEEFSERHARDGRDGCRHGCAEDNRIGIQPERAGGNDAETVDPQKEHRDHADKKPVWEIAASDVRDELNANVRAAE